jgi:serine/threonine-protein kinase
VLADRYTLAHQLGQGGMATVYEAHDDLLDRPVAVKLLRVEGLRDRGARQRFAAEARAAARISHPHAVAVYDVGVDDQPYIVMELVRGGTLEDVLADTGPLAVPTAVAVTAQVLAALHEAHQRGLVHRDVKPANILLPDGRLPERAEQLPGVKLADFGIAKATQDATVGLTAAGQIIGTPKYVSPEQVSGERATPRSDLYATAVVLYEMLAGRPPFERDSAVALALAHRTDEPPRLDRVRPDLPRPLVALVHQALGKDPADRPVDAERMREALLSGTTAPAGTLPLPGGSAPTEAVGRPERVHHADALAPPPAPDRPPRSGRVVRWVVVLVALGLAGALAVQWLSGRVTSDDPAPGDEAPAVDEADPGADGDGGDQAPDEPAPQDQAPAPDDGAAPGDDGAAPDDEPPADAAPGDEPAPAEPAPAEPAPEEEPAP